MDEQYLWSLEFEKKNKESSIAEVYEDKRSIEEYDLEDLTKSNLKLNIQVRRFIVKRRGQELV